MELQLELIVIRVVHKTIDHVVDVQVEQWFIIENVSHMLSVVLRR